MERGRLDTLTLFDLKDYRPATVEIDLFGYSSVIVCLSGGKDSLACFLWLLEQDYPIGQIELWHHLVDGDGDLFMDWPCTSQFCKAIAIAFNIPIYYSGKVGGFEGEMLRENTRTAPIFFETPEDTVEYVGGIGGKESTRRMFPQTSMSLTTRWCSAYLKVMVCDCAIRHQVRFNNTKTLVITGERGDESAARAKYKQFEPHRSDARKSAKLSRYVDRYRPVLWWDEAEVWEIIERWGLEVHPAYHLGFGRVSCQTCIFASDQQWATLYAIDPERVKRIAAYEEEFGKTILLCSRATVLERALRSKPYPNLDPIWIEAVLSDRWYLSIIKAPGEWRLPAGAFGENTGPT